MARAEENGSYVDVTYRRLKEEALWCLSFGFYSSRMVHLAWNHADLGDQLDVTWKTGRSGVVMLMATTLFKWSGALCLESQFHGNQSEVCLSVRTSNCEKGY